MIPRDFIDTLLARVDIVDFIDRRVPLKKAGQNYQACCPFHNEKTPSFTVSPTKQFYHCFGCGAHGTVLGFLMEYEHMSFRDAVAALAQDAGLVVPESSQVPDQPKPPPALWDALEQAKKNRETLLSTLRRLEFFPADKNQSGMFDGNEYLERTRKAIQDDLNTPEALAAALEA